MAIKNFKVQISQCSCGCGIELNLYDNRNRLRKFVHGHNPTWNKGLKYGLQPWHKIEGLELGRQYRDGLKLGQGWNKGIPNTNMMGEKNHNWKGGVSKINKKERALAMETIEYKQWRLEVFKRDEFKCQVCGSDRSGQLEADHKKPWSVYKELRYEIDNGLTLCKECHQTKTLLDHKLFQFRRFRWPQR